jgi:ubiquitin thioesterase protein OTUB1
LITESKKELSHHEATALQEKAIEDEVNKQKAAGSLENPSVLLEEYKDNAAFLPKIQQLCQKYTGIRRSRGDGNCFYRSVAFQTLNFLRQSTTDGELEAGLLQHKEVLDGLVNSFGHQRFIVESFYESFCDSARELHGKKICDLEALFQTPVEMYFVYWIRLVTSFAIQSKAEAFLPFIIALGFSDAKTFCESQVEPAKVDADNLPIQALAEYMGWLTKVEYLDAAGGDLNQHQFGTKSTDGKSSPVILLLYRPGHYDMLEC